MKNLILSNIFSALLFFGGLSWGDDEKPFLGHCQTILAQSPAVFASLPPLPDHREKRPQAERWAEARQSGVLLGSGPPQLSPWKRYVYLVDRYGNTVFADRKGDLAVDLTAEDLREGAEHLQRQMEDRIVNEGLVEGVFNGHAGLYQQLQSMYQQQNLTEIPVVVYAGELYTAELAEAGGFSVQVVEINNWSGSFHNLEGSNDLKALIPLLRERGLPVHDKVLLQQYSRHLQRLVHARSYQYAVLEHFFNHHPQWSELRRQFLRFYQQWVYMMPHPEIPGLSRWEQIVTERVSLLNTNMEAFRRATSEDLQALELFGTVGHLILGVYNESVEWALWTWALQLSTNVDKSQILKTLLSGLIDNLEAGSELTAEQAVTLRSTL